MREKTSQERGLDERENSIGEDIMRERERKARENKIWKKYNTPAYHTLKRENAYNLRSSSMSVAKLMIVRADWRGEREGGWVEWAILFAMKTKNKI